MTRPLPMFDLRSVDLFAGGGGASEGIRRAPRELATAQGFGPEYILGGTQESQIARIGNSVPPPVVEALVAAQFPTRAVWSRRAAAA